MPAKECVKSGLSKDIYDRGYRGGSQFITGGIVFSPPTFVANQTWETKARDKDVFPELRSEHTTDFPNISKWAPF